LKEAQSLAVKRAEVEFHNFASLGEPERAMQAYAEQNVRRGAMLRAHRAFAGELSPFLEIGANAVLLAHVVQGLLLEKTRLHRGRAMLRDALCTRVGAASASAFEFHLLRCDAVVRAVLDRLRAPAPPSQSLP
jgi:hypothetical protein